MSEKEEEEVWYADGLQFTCNQCGNCCTGDSGYVWFNEQELEAMAKHLAVTPQEFLERYARQLNRHMSLKEIKRSGQYDCVFLVRDPETKHVKCSIYPVRPTQCRTWPFWNDTVESLRTYASAARDCVGMARGLEGKGEQHSYTQIRIRCDSTPH